jgi:outer membrane lipoprotein-sorting protein
MRKEFWFLVLILSSAVAFGQPAGFTPVASPETVKKELSAKAAALQSMKSKFTQDKNMQMLSEKITSSGSFSFKQPDKVRMEYQSPFTYLLVIDGDKVTIRDGQKTNSFSAGNNRMFTIINRVILDCVRGTVFSNTDFEHTVYSGKGE